MKNFKVLKNPFFLFLPFLVIYIIIIIAFPTNGMSGDEVRYLGGAKNLIHGFYSPPAPNIYLPNGPGYSIILMPFLALNLPLICITLLNGLFYYLSIVFLFKSIREFSSFNLAFIFSLFWALFFDLYEFLPIIYTETFTAFLITMLLYSVIKTFNLNNTNNIYLYLSGFFLGFLALTKVIFGYVLIFLFLGYIVSWLIKKHSPNYKKTFLVLLIAFLVTSPYLIYTQKLTGKVFYWSNYSGDNLFWMTSPYKGEYGNWLELPVVHKKNRIDKSTDLIKLNHEKDYNEIKNLTALEQDSVLKRKALNNIKTHPAKFLVNWFSNVGRILFNFPYSYELEKPGTLLRLPFNGIIVVLSLFCLIPTFKNWKKLFFPIRFLFWFTSLYLGASSLASAETRMFTMVVPILLFWIAYILQKAIKIKIKFDEDV